MSDCRKASHYQQSGGGAGGKRCDRSGSAVRGGPLYRKEDGSISRYGQLIVNVAKGIEEHTLTTLTDMIEEEIPISKVLAPPGPSHAEEVEQDLPTTCVVGAKRKETAEYLQNIFMSPAFRVYISPDMLGIELGGATSLPWQREPRTALDTGTTRKRR